MRSAAGDSRPASPAAIGLTGKQIDVLALLMQGKSNKAISRALDLAEPTVKYHVTTIIKALGVSNRTEAVLAVGRLGWKLRPREPSATPAATARNVPASAPPLSAPQPAAPSEQPQADSQPALPLPDKPSIVVLPFVNLSGDPAQDYFADGMVEDITLALGRLTWLFVIGSSSAFTYKNRPVDARQVGVELGVRYVLRGSVRKEADRLRITAELTDASDGGRIWADRFEGELNSVFAMQDTVAAHVSTMIAPALRTAEIERADRKPTASLTAYDLFLRALRRPRDSLEQNRESLRLLYQAIEHDPCYGAAYGLAAYCHFVQKMYGWVPPTDPCLQEGLRLAGLAAETGRRDSEALWMAAQTLVFLGGEYERALPLIEESLSLNPNSPAAYEASGMAHAFCGNTEIALEHSARAQRHNPSDPLVVQYWTSTAYVNFYAGRYEIADRAADRILSCAPSFTPALRLKAVTCGLLGRQEEGRKYAKQARAAQPWLTVAAMRAFYGVPLRKHPRALDDLLKGLRASGVPEE